MIQYDCIVCGNNIYGLTVALFLARKMRKVLVIQDFSRLDDYSETIDITDPENNKYHFEYNSKGIASGLDTDGLFYAYLDDLGLEDEISFTKIYEDNVVCLDNSIRRRIHTFLQFKVYLVRNYPKSRDQIHKFFYDMNRHYENYVDQNTNLLRNNDYTLSSLMIEWGDYSLFDLLKKYFTDENIQKEFLVNSMINGLNSEEINSYNFFSNYFLGLKKGFYYLNDSEKEIRNKIINKIKLLNPKSVIKTKIKDFVRDDSGKIKHIVDKDDNQYSARFFFVENNPIKFYESFFTDFKEDIDIIKNYYPNLESKNKINTIYLATNAYPKTFGVNELIYYFVNNNDTNERVIKLFNYSLFSNQDKKKNQGLICIDYTFDDEIGDRKEEILKRVYEAFPKLKKAVVGMKDGKPKPFFSMLSNLEFRKNLTINELIEIESFEHIQVIENLYVGTNDFRPESGYFGVFNQAIVFADKIEDRMYYGDADEGLSHYLKNEEIMTMIKHNYDYKKFEEKEIHINFYIGKNNYFIRTKSKNIVVHLGKYMDSDLSIYTTNDTLSNLLLRKTTFEEVFNDGSLKFRGDKDLLFKAVEAFNLDDYQEYNLLEYKKSSYRNLGAKILFAYLFVYSMVCLLSNYVNGIYIYPVALVFTVLIAIFKIKKYEEVYWFDFFVNILFLLGVVLSIFWKDFNVSRFDDPALLIMGLTLMISSFFKHSIVYNYTKFDQNIDYRDSKLYKIITNGLTFIWGFIFLTILVAVYITGQRYVTVLYNLYFLGIFLMYYYPVIYVNTNIKK